MSMSKNRKVSPISAHDSEPDAGEGESPPIRNLSLCRALTIVPGGGYISSLRSILVPQNNITRKSKGGQAGYEIYFLFGSGTPALIRTRNANLGNSNDIPFTTGAENETDEIRTRDPRLKRPVLYQLSYGLIKWCAQCESNA